MPVNNNGSRQAFSELVAAEAWHAPFVPGAKVDLCVDVVFGTARMGDESSSPVRFRLSLRAAEVVVIVPAVEPVSVDPRSVSRDSPRLTGQRTAVRSQSTKRSFGGRLFAGFGRAGPAAGINGAFAAERANETSDTIEGTSAVESIAITQSRSEDGHYRWLLAPQLSDTLDGRPWDPVQQPRLGLIDDRSSAGGIPPGVRVEVRCRREDLVVSELTLKDEALWRGASARTGFRNRMAAAESYIRDRLIEEGLQVGDMDELFSRLTLASVAAMPHAAA